MLAQTLARPSKTTWNPLQKQYWDAATTFLLDPDQDTADGITVGSGAPGAFVNAHDAHAVTVVAGKYRKGFQTTTGSSDYAYLMAYGLVPKDEFTVEFWVNLDLDMKAKAIFTKFITIGDGNNRIEFGLDGSHNPQVALFHLQNPATPLTTYSKSAGFSISSGQYPAGWHHFAATLKSGTLTLFLDGVQKAQATGTITPQVSWGEGSVQPLASNTSFTDPALVLSDLRISRLARTLSSSAAPSPVSTIVVGASSTGSTITKLSGYVKQIGPSGDQSPAVPDMVGTTQAGTDGTFRFVKVHRFIRACPILASGTPDAAHPTVGHSGLYCYDFQALDRTLAAVKLVGAKAYMALESTPSILGGGSTPFVDVPMTTTGGSQQPDVSGTLNVVSTAGISTAQKEFSYSGNRYAFTGNTGTTLSGVTLISGTASLSIPTSSTIHQGWGPSMDLGDRVGDNAQVPTDFNAYATIAVDFLHHAWVQYGLTETAPFYCCAFNEPDQPSEWVGTPAQYFSLWRTMLDAIKTYAAAQFGSAGAILFCGPETSANDPTNTTWIQAFINDLAANSKTLDGFSCHFYTGNSVSYWYTQTGVAHLLSAAGLPAAQAFLNTEDHWSQFIDGNDGDGGQGYYPWFQPNGKSNSNQIPPVPQVYTVQYTQDAFYCAWEARKQIAEQAAGWTASLFFSGRSGNLFVNGSPRGPYHVMRMRSMTAGNSILQTTTPTTIDPGITYEVSKDGGGKIWVFISCLHNRKGRTYPVTIDVSAQGITDGTTAVQYLVDDQHSNFFDAGTGHEALETVPIAAVANGKVSLRLRARSVALVKIG